MRRLTLAAIAAITLPAMAQAACPTRADVEKTGIWVKVHDGSAIQYTITGDGAVRELYVFEDGNDFWVDAINGLYVVRDGALKDGKNDPAAERQMTYPNPLSELPAVDTPGTHKIVVKVTEPKSGKVTDETTVMTVGPATTLALGDCTYNSRLITMITDRPDGTNTLSQLHHLPDLGLAYYIAHGTREEFLTDTYRPVGISTTRP